MNKEELAEKLNGRKYGDEITKEEAKEAANNGLVVVYGASDDLCEIAGKFVDEVGCYNGGTVYIDKHGLYSRECECESCPHEIRAMEAHQTIEAKWDDNDKGFSWTYETDIPHTTFEILEDGSRYCKGIVFSVNDLK